MAKIINEKHFKFDLPAGKKKERVDLFLTGQMENATRTRIQKLIEQDLVTVNGKVVKSNFKVAAGDVVELTLPITPRPEYAEPEDIPVDVVFEDEYLLVVNKPAGQVVHPAYANYTGTLVNALLHHIDELSEDGDPQRPGIVHRIDKDTSGLLVVAKDEFTHAKLAELFSTHTIEREYWTVVWGLFNEKQGEINRNIARSKRDRKVFNISDDEGKHAVTLWEVIEEFEFTTLLKVNLKTGRTHQIRVHFSGMRHPVFGDEIYGGTSIVYGHQLPKMKSRIHNLLKIMPRQALHAKTLGFRHPHTGEMVRFDSELPEDMQQLITTLRKQAETYIK